MRKKWVGAWMLVCMLLISVLGVKAEESNPKPLYPAIQGHLWGYIDADNQWVVLPYTLEQPWPAYDNERLYDGDWDEWLDWQGRRHTVDEVMDPAFWNLKEVNGQPVYRCDALRFGQSWLVRCYAAG